MSVVNKMLQDLEARQSQTVEITADYQPPQKKHSTLLILVLLTLAITAITFALIDKNWLLSENKNTEITASENSQSLPFTTKKMTAAPNKIQQEQVQSPITSASPPQVNIELVEAAPDTILASTVTTDKPTTPNKHQITPDNLPFLQNIDTQDGQIEKQDSTAINTQTTTEQISSFSMSDASQEGNTSSLKQRITNSLNNENLDLAQSLLHELLAAEPDNIKTRKKLASLLFAKNNYAQTKQLLVKGIELHPTKGDLKLMLARLYVVQKKPSQAMNILVEFQPSTDIQTEYLAYRAALAQKLKQTELARSDYQTLTNIESSNAKWWLGLAIAEDQLGEISMAVHAYNKSSSLGQLDGSVNDFIQQRISILTGAQ